MFKKLLLPILVAISLTGCSTSNHSAHDLVAQDVVIRATDVMSKMENGTLMTGVFMTLTNNSKEDITLIGGKSETAPKVEVHEVVDGKMQLKQGGVVIKAGKSEVFKPGGNHVMLMGMTEPLAAGGEVTVTLYFDNGSELVITGPVKVVNLAPEHYHSGEPTPTMSGM